MRVTVAAGVAGAASLAASVVRPLAGAAYEEGGSAWMLAELGVLLAGAVLAIRVAPPGGWLYAAALPALAVPAWLLRFGLVPVSAQAWGGFAGWGLVAGVAA